LYEIIETDEDLPEVQEAIKRCEEYQNRTKYEIFKDKCLIKYITWRYYTKLYVMHYIGWIKYYVSFFYITKE
jgi:hypothetical protein